MSLPPAGQPVRPLAAVPRRTLPSHWRDSAAFLWGFVRNPSRVGSVAPSSGRLERRLVREAQVAQARTVVELGPGTGGTTVALLQAMRPSARLLAIELDPQFHGHVARRVHDARLHLALDSAERLESLLAAYGLGAADAIVSGIPFSTLPCLAADRVAAAVARALRPGGRFVAYQVRAHVEDYVAPYLGPPKQAWEWVNLPPVRVFTWVRSRQHGDRTSE